MALFSLNFLSKFLSVPTEVSIIMPQLAINSKITPKDFYSPSKKYKVLWLLHGANSDHTSWLRYTNIERYVENRDLIVVMPSALNSDYSNYTSFADGYNYWDFFTEELMPLIYGWLPASQYKEDNFISGLSMGGNGALMIALGYPDLFAGVGILSSTAREIEYLRPYAEITSGEFRKIASDPVRFPGLYGLGMRQKEINQVAKYATVGDFLNSCENSWDRLPEVIATGKLPKMYVSCGTNDHKVYPRFLRFKNYMNKLGSDATFVEVEGYKHEYDLWDREILNVLEFFGIGKNN